MTNLNSYYLPLGKEHLELQRIADGGRNIVVSRSKLEDLADDMTLEEVADLVLRSERLDTNPFRRYYVVQDPESSGENLLIRKVLSVEGQELFEGLEAGLLWNPKVHVKDIGISMTWYRDMMKSGRVESRYADLLANGKSEDLREIRNELIYFRMRGTREGDRLIAIKDHVE